MTDIKVLDGRHPYVSRCAQKEGLRSRCGLVQWLVERTLIPSWEKQGGTAELSSSASFRRMGKFSTADMGMSPR